MTAAEGSTCLGLLPTVLGSPGVHPKGFGPSWGCGHHPGSGLSWTRVTGREGSWYLHAVGQRLTAPHVPSCSLQAYGTSSPSWCCFL